MASIKKTESGKNINKIKRKSEKTKNFIYINKGNKNEHETLISTKQTEIQKDTSSMKYVVTYRQKHLRKLTFDQVGRHFAKKVKIAEK